MPERSQPPQPPAAARGRREAPVDLDIVIPMYQEEAVLPALLAELARTFSGEVRARHGIARVHCVFVDDGSGDGSAALLERTPVPGLGVTLVRLSRNFGHQAAVTAGLAHTRAELVAVIDADLQDPPEVVLRMIDAWREGYEVVYAQRRNRQEGWLKRGLYAAFYRLYRLLSPIDVPLDSGDFCLMGRRALDVLDALPETVRFPRGLRSWVGFPQTAVPYDRPARAAGESHYGWRDLYDLATDGIAALSIRPLQLAQFLALLYLLLSAVGVTAILLNAFSGVELRTQLNLILVLMLASNCVILFCMYILGAYLGRAYWEVKRRPGYIVADVAVLAEPAAAARSGARGA